MKNYIGVIFWGIVIISGIVAYESFGGNYVYAKYFSFFLIGAVLADWVNFRNNLGK